ncbi:head decoration protein [Escherichia coli]
MPATAGTAVPVCRLMTAVRRWDITSARTGTSTRKLVAWDGTTDGAAVGILAVAADQTSTTLTFYKSGTFRYEDVLWPEAASDETKKRTAFAGTAISIV